MPIITRSCLDAIKRQVNIYDVVCPVVTLKPSGRNFRGLSPFSNEKTPSFFVLPDKDLFKCFSTTLAGDIFRFLELTEKLTFVEAVEAIAERFNLEITYEKGAAPRKEDRSLRRTLLDIHDYACAFYRDAFNRDDEYGNAIRKYWVEDRGFPLECAARYGIGLGPIDGSALAIALAKRGFAAESLRKSGLFYAHDRDNDPRTFWSRFRGRLMIPIRNTQGQVIAFTARKLDFTPGDDPAHEAKYINSPETPIFHKSSVVFGLDEARKHLDGEKAFLLVEGQLDALRCWHHGFTTAVAPQGTSITVDQLQILKRYTGRLYCILDGDEAGEKAAFRILPMAFKTGLEIRFVRLPKDADPDTILAREGSASFRDEIHSAISAIEFAVTTLIDSGDTSAHIRTQALLRIFEIVTECGLLVLREELISEAADLLSLNPESAQRDFQAHLRRSRRGLRREDELNAREMSEKIAPERLTTSEYELLLVVFHYRGVARQIAEVVENDWIDQNSIHGRLLNRILVNVQEELWDGPDDINHILENPDEINAAYAVYAEDPGFEDPIHISNDCIRALLNRYVKEECRRLETQIANLPYPSDDYPRLQKELTESRQRRRHPPQLSPFQPAPATLSS